ncbi:hypothetical protein B0H16DRAFT_1889710 [Mycena metata]|uniref:Uncharacterized protein n=1 Tax=Mycena metata TaxID=1033252 RepID=A0AAD7N3M8_9AGAR|nr:hypothetical protein B0H16DRAFT_1889710 [Mycena metata]
MARPMYKCFGVLLIISLGLFLGLFFGLNYPGLDRAQIVKHGWPLTRCTVLSSGIATRYCCETSCQTSSCQTAPSGSPGCSGLVSSIDSGYSPSMCAANSSACPTQVGSVCDGPMGDTNVALHAARHASLVPPGTIALGNPLSDHTGQPNRSSSCSNGSCTESCTTYQCNCYCCSSTNDLYCTLSCPICYDVDLKVNYASRDGVSHNVSYTQDFKKDVNKADSFFGGHTTNSTGFCYYNPKDETQILFDVNFTPWKWAVFALFGALPLFVALSLFAYFLLIRPAWNLIRLGYGDMLDAAKEGAKKPVKMVKALGGKLKGKGKEAEGGDKDEEMKKIEQETDRPPPAYKPSDLQNDGSP